MEFILDPRSVIRDQGVGIPGESAMKMSPEKRIEEAEVTSDKLPK
jgi:hypothetical protein